MLKNYFKIAFRNLLKHKRYSFINIIGLAPGLTYAILIYIWLQDFAYRINIGWWVFALAGVIVLFIAIITISFQAVKAVISNPIEALKYE